MTRSQLVVVAAVSFLQPAAAENGYSLAEQQTAQGLCGRAVAVSCEGPSSPVTFLLAVPGADALRRVVIPSERRSVFGERIETRYEQRQVGVVPPGGRGNDPLTVSSPAELTVTGAAEPSAALPNDVLRTCDPDVRRPIVVHVEYGQSTTDGTPSSITGVVVLQGVVVRDGSVRNIRVVQPLDPRFDAAARSAFSKWRFRPALRGQEPVSMAVTVQMPFDNR